MTRIRRGLGGIIVGCLMAMGGLAAEQVYVLKTPEFDIQAGADGFHRIAVPGYSFLGEPGGPELPSRIFRIAVPPDIDPDSIMLDFTETGATSLGRFHIRELPPMRTWGEGLPVQAGKADVFRTDAPFPANPVELLGLSRIRKWRLVSLRYTPFRYNPVSEDLSVIPETTVRIRYRRNGLTPLPGGQMADTRMDSRVHAMLLNPGESAAWYGSAGAMGAAPQAGSDYVIITTNAIQGSSTRLEAFLVYLTARGFTPRVVTESDFGSLTGPAPNGTAEKIRCWLIDNYAAEGIEYVLLIGNPSPGGDIPMKMCWPRRGESTYQESPTDYYYADLTGDWDLDGDGYFGEWPDDNGTGGVDFANEVHVGRIPVYSGVSSLDSVLAKIMAYGSASSISWRSSALLAMSFSDASTDGAYLGEAMMSDYLGSSSIGSWTLYMQGGVCLEADSTFPSSQELVDGAVRTRWAADPRGLVWWWGHGSSSSASLGYSGCGWGNIMNSGVTYSLNDDYPAFVYQCSCLNGYPESSSNLGTALLYNGAIGTLSATRVSWYAVTSWSPGLKYYCDNASIGYFYGKELAASGKSAGEALYDVKADMGASHYTSWDGCHWMNLFDFNLYGDPATGLADQGVSHIVSTPSSPDGPASGEVGVSLSFSTGGSACSRAHAVSYRFDWGDGNFSAWSSSGSASHSWSLPGPYSVRSQARCSVDTTVLSGWSAPHSVTISQAAGTHSLTIAAEPGGTTNPAPGTTYHDHGTSVVIEAFHQTGYVFSHWTGDVPSGLEGANPLNLTMDGDRGLTANFQAQPGAGGDNYGVHRSSNGRFYLDTDWDGQAEISRAYGGCDDTPVTGDWDGDGVTDIGVYRPSNARFYLDTDGDSFADIVRPYGAKGDIPLTGDWDGDGDTDIGVYRPSNARFYLDTDGDSYADIVRTYGGRGDTPVTGDWDGDGDTDIGVHRSSNARFYLDTNGDSYADIVRPYGGRDDTPVTGDWNGDGRTNYGVFRPSNARFYLDISWDGFADRVRVFGTPTDHPVTGNWDGV